MIKAEVTLPERTFLYTLDQIAYMIGYGSVQIVKDRFIFFDGSTGRMPPYLMRARNIANPSERPEWRVSEGEFDRWLRGKGYKYDKKTRTYR